MMILSIVGLYVQMWHLAGTRWSCRERQLIRSWRDCRRERDVNVRMSWCDLLSWRGQRGDVGLMTLVLGHVMLLQRLAEWILRTYAIVWRQCYRMCLRAYGLASRMRVSWSNA
jgi:hypothetical protein